MFYRVYLASSGLRTPFFALLEATRAYTRDASVLLRNAPIGAGQQQALIKSIKAANTRMLLSRIRDVYRHRLSPPELFVCLIRVLQFRFGRYPL